jgi:putative ABC transport system permease protein
MSSLWFSVTNIFRVALRRLLAERGLAIAAALGLTAAVGLIFCVPLYTDAVHFRVLRETLLGPEPRFQNTPLTFRFRYVGARDGTLQYEDVQAIDQYLDQMAANVLGLPKISLVHHYKTDIFRIYPTGDVQSARGKSITWLSFATLNNLDQALQLKAGHMPASLPGSAGEPVEVLVNETIADQFGWQPGNSFLAVHNEQKIPIQIAGIWAPANPVDTYWSPPIDEIAFVPEPVFAQTIAAQLPDEIYLGIWQLSVEGGNLHVGDVPPLLQKIKQVELDASTQLPKTVMDLSPVEALTAYQKGVPILTLQLFAYSVPILGLLFVYISLVAGLYVERQRNQIAVLRSRGASVGQVMSIALVEGLLLGCVALLLGTPLGMGIARLIGRARSFLNFTGADDLRVSITGQSFAFAFLAVFIALIAQLLPTLRAAGHTIVTYKQERARLLRSPWWQRIWLDGLLLIPTGYGFYLLNRQGRMAAHDITASSDLFQNPLLYLVPALGLFALALFLARILPLVMGLIARANTRTRSVGALLATRELSRSPGFFAAPLILLTLTLSLSAFTASLAGTLDGHLIRQQSYSTGADIRLSEEGLSSGGENNQPKHWLFRPVSVHLQVPGVIGATRVGRYQAIVQGRNGPAAGLLLGVDRFDFPGITYWQNDFASEPLGALMNQLALTPQGVLIDQNYADGMGLKIGDVIQTTVNAYDYSLPILVKVVGIVYLFPTWYPDGTPLLVGNLDFIYSQLGAAVPYEVWLKTLPQSDQRKIVAKVSGLTVLLDPTVDPSTVDQNGLNIVVRSWKSSQLEIYTEQRRPQRQGLFGLLSVGFIASAVLTVLGFLLYALFSFRRRMIEFGVLRAIGLRTRQMVGLLTWELASLVWIGMVAGTGLGVWVSTWFIPYLQIGIEISSRIPPFVVVIAWPAIMHIYAVFVLLFLLALAGLTALLLRMKIFQAVKLGETL